MIISIFIPHGGCPERCTFCDQKVSGGTPTPLKNVIDTIESHLKTKTNSSNIEVALYGGTFTALSKETQLRYLNTIKPYLESGKVQSIRISTRPDAIEYEWISFLKNNYTLKTVELGVQSFEQNVLTTLGRSHSLENLQNSTSILKSLAVRVGFHLMYGCPGETKNLATLIIKYLLELKPDFVRYHPLLVLKNTALEESFRLKKFEPINLEEAINLGAELVSKTEELGIRVLRIGLQPNELLGEAVVAGPFHPSLGELVRGRILRNELEHLFLLSKRHKQSLSIFVAPQLKSLLIGKNHSNIEYLKNIFELTSLGVFVLEGERSSFYEKQPNTASYQIRISNASRPSKRWEIELI
jgi:histone acetyltransferase (RNA polymerase elongator complex component)